MFIVAVPKSDNTIQLCLDMRQANKAIQRERHVIPKIDDMLQDLHGARYFTKIDLREGYHQLMLHPESRPITAFATHKGIYQYKRLIYGVNSAFESFQKQIEQALTDCTGAKNISDDILIWGDTIEQLDNRFAKVLGRFNRLGLKINLKKCTFATQKLIFAGHHISPQGVSPDPNKVNIIQNAKTPSNVSEIKSFLGMINYSSQYIQNYSTISESLRRLTKKSESFTWGETQQAACDKLRSEITKSSYHGIV